MAGVHYDRVTKKYGPVVALDELTLAVEDKEFLVLVGPSGSGKSTALRMLAGLEEISSGDVYIGDRRVNDVPPKDRDIAMVFQTYALYPHMTVFDNMAFGLSLRGTPKDEIYRRVQDAATMLGIEDLLDRKPRQLSGGQRQRVALGRAIVRVPAVFLLDEPLSNLDAKLRVQTRTQISKLHRRLEATFIYVTHDQVEAMTMATRIAVMDNALLQQVGAPQEVYDNPANLFVAGFIGSPAMNLLEVTLTGSQEDMYLDAGDFKAQVPDEKTAALAAFLGKPVVFGIRPENVHDRAFVPPGIQTTTVRAKVEVTELMGNEVFLHLRIGPRELLARVDARTKGRPGMEIDVALDLSKMHAFDPETELALAT